MIVTTASLIKKYDSPSGLVSFVVFQVEKKFTFQEGQFMMIEGEISGKKYRKPYSIATTNQQLQEKGEIGFIIKKASQGGMSNFLTQKINIHDQVSIKGALGHYIDSKKHKNYLFISTGSGLSPNLGLFQHLVYESKKYSKILNIYGERYYTQIVPEVEKTFTQHKQKDIHNIFCFSKEEELFSLPKKPLKRYKKGYVQEHLQEAINLLGQQTTCFVCGIPAMVDDVRNKLQELGIDKGDIIFEKY